MDPTVVVRPLDAGEMPLFLDFDTPTSGEAYGPPGRAFLDTAADGRYRPGWTWVATRDGLVVARAAFWGGPDDDHPLTVDWFDVAAHAADRVDVGAALLRDALAAVTPPGGDRPEYHLFLAPDWRDDAAEGAHRVVADTDTGNTPIAAAFARAGYAVTGRRVVMT